MLDRFIHNRLIVYVITRKAAFEGAAKRHPLAWQAGFKGVLEHVTEDAAQQDLPGIDLVVEDSGIQKDGLSLGQAGIGPESAISRSRPAAENSSRMNFRSWLSAASRSFCAWISSTSCRATDPAIGARSMISWGDPLPCSKPAIPSTLPAVFMMSWKKIRSRAWRRFSSAMFSKAMIVKATPRKLKGLALIRRSKGASPRAVKLLNQQGVGADHLPIFIQNGNHPGHGVKNGQQQVITDEQILEARISSAEFRIPPADRGSNFRTLAKLPTP